MKCVGGAILLWAFWLCAARAQSLEAPALHWVRGPGAESCIDPRELALRVSGITGSLMAEPSSAVRSIEGYVQRLANAEFEVRIRLSGHDGSVVGERQFKQAGPCRELDPAIAFVIAVLIDPDLALQRLPPELVGLGAEGPAPDQRLLNELEQTPTQAPPASPVAQPEAAAPSAAPVAAASSPPVAQPRMELSAAANLAFRESPRVGMGPALGFAYLLPKLALEVQVRALFGLGQHHDASDPVPGHPSVSTLKLDALLLACPRLRAQRLLLEGCFGAEVGYLRASGHRYMQDDTADLVTLAATAVLGLGLEVGSAWSLRLRGLLFINLLSPTIESWSFAGAHNVFQTPGATGAIQLGVSYAF